MTESTLFADLLAAQMEMPALQKSAINPHFRNRYVPLEELLQTVVPILNKHNFVLLQSPTIHDDGQPALEYRLLHVSGESVMNTMPLMSAKDDPQAQGSAITYARRYSLMSLLGLTADADDDAEATRAAPRAASGPTPIRGGQERPSNGDAPVRPPSCKEHGSMQFIKAGTSKAGKPYPSFWSCVDRECKTAINHADWLSQSKQLEAVAVGYDPDDLPFDD